MKARTAEKLVKYLMLIVLPLYDLAAVVGALVIALILRFDYFRVEYLHKHEVSAPLVLLTYIVVFYLFRLYRYRWPFAGVETLWSIFLANVIATVLSTIWQVHLDGERMPHSVIVLTCVFATVFIGGQRLLMRTVARHLARKRKADARTRWREEPMRTLIISSDRGVMEVLTALEHEHAGRYEVIGILDPDARHHGKYVRGIKVLGPPEMLHELMRQHAVDEVIIALANPGTGPLRDYVLACCRQKVAVRTIPVAAEWLANPSATRRQLHTDSIHAEDLLHRQPIEVSSPGVKSYFTGKRVLVTGAGGSIGAELCRQICRFGPEKQILLGHGENSIHQILLELQRSFPCLKEGILPVICDVRDAQRLNYLMARYRPQVVLHAAAHKHVPLMEGNVAEAVTNNVAGTRNLARAATAHNVERMLLISTDKAVNPSSVMGATKYLCEELVRAEAERSSTTFITVRFGNVLGSRGSVLPIFQEQILYGGPIQVTHPEMSRYFMTIPEAVSLVLFAGVSGQTGQLFVLDMGNPVRIVTLAEDVIRLSGLVPYHDINIEYCGLRPGEKLSEELFTEQEQRLSSSQERLLMLDRPQHMEPATLDKEIDALLTIAGRNNDEAVLQKLRQLVPTFREEKTNQAATVVSVPRRAESRGLTP